MACIGLQADKMAMNLIFEVDWELLEATAQVLILLDRPKSRIGQSDVLKRALSLGSTRSDSELCSSSNPPGRKRISTDACMIRVLDRYVPLAIDD